MGLKHEARRRAIAAEVPVLPGSELVETLEEAIEQANSVGFPVSFSLDLRYEPDTDSLESTDYAERYIGRRRNGDGNRKARIGTSRSLSENGRYVKGTLSLLVLRHIGLLLTISP